VELRARVLLLEGALVDALAAQLRSSGNVTIAHADFFPESPDDYGAAARGVKLKRFSGGLDAPHSPTRFILPTDSWFHVGSAGPNKNLPRLLAAVSLLRVAHEIDLVNGQRRAWDQLELRRALAPDTPPW